MPDKSMLYCASTVSHLRNFHLPYIRALAEKGYRITICAEQQEAIHFVVDFFTVPFCKSITSPENLKNIVRLYRFLKQEQFTAISVHTTLAAVLVRVTVLLLPEKQRPKVFYICHGYLFGKHDGWRKWKYLLPEKICAAVTDVLMTMNQEDKQLAEQYSLYQGQLISIPGMGVDFSLFDLHISKNELRRQWKIEKDAILFVFAGEFSERKNQQQLITAFASVVEEMPKARLILAGQGALLETCKGQVHQLGLDDVVLFPGHVKEMAMLYHCCDVCVSASKVEGLPFNIMEAMYCGLPCIASNVKGHADLIVSGKNGYLYNSQAELSQFLVKLYNEEGLRQKLGQQGKEDAEQYRLELVLPQIMQVYEEYW